MTSRENAPKQVRGGSAPPLDFERFLALTLNGLRHGRIGETLALVERAPSRWQAHNRTAVRMAYAHAAAGQIALTLSWASQVADDRGLTADDYDLLGNALTLVHQPEQAYTAFARAVQLRPDDTALLCNKAATARFLGRAPEAEALYEQVLSAHPTRWDAYRNRAELKRQTRQHNHVDQLRDLLSRPLPVEGEIQLSYALGKELEDLEEWDEAFACFTRGARTRRARMRYDLQDDLKTFHRIAAHFDERYCRLSPDDAGARGGPIFIVGLPRTGSTLLERMLGRHSRIQPLGELQILPRAVVAAARAQGAIASKAELIAAAAAAPPGNIGSAYMDQVAPLRDGSPFFTDKLPTNALYLGPIARALPEAKIIHLRRKPLDACVAMYKSLFDEGYPFSYDLEELGRYHVAHDRLMEHWHAVLGARIATVNYEDLVLAPEATLNNLFDALGLSFEEACLTPNKATAPVMTASASQVRDPVHSRSIDLSLHYDGWLTSLNATLQQNICRHSVKAADQAAWR